jgi:hypothetical protein
VSETVLPTAEAPAADATAGEQPNQAEALASSTSEQGEAQGDEAKEAKPEKTPEQREVERLRRKIDRLVRQREELRARVPEPQELRQQNIDGINRQPQDDSEPLSLSRAELQRLVNEEAKKLAPTIKQQQAEIEHRKGVIQTLAKTWGQEKFDTLAADLDDTFGGLADANGRPKPATDAIFEADDPAAVIEFLTDPDNAETAESIARMNDRQAGRAIAKLEAQIAAKKATGKPQASKAPAPLEALRGAGKSESAGPDPSDTKAWIRWRNEQERKGL